MKIREMLGTDLRKGFNESIKNLFPDVELTKDKGEVFRKRLKCVNTYIAEEDNKVIGTCSLFMDAKYGHNGKCAGHIEDVSVDPEYTGHGVGLALVKHAVNEAQKLDCYKVILSCSVKNVGFYEKCGFRQSGQVEMRIDL